MKVFNDKNQLVDVVCNSCGKHLKVHKGMLMEAAYEGKQNFGYFSEKDGTTHKFDLCESCYDKMISEFMIPVTKKEEFEWQAE